MHATVAAHFFAFYIHTGSVFPKSRYKTWPGIPGHHIPVHILLPRSPVDPSCRASTVSCRILVCFDIPGCQRGGSGGSRPRALNRAMLAVSMLNGPVTYMEPLYAQGFADQCCGILRYGAEKVKALT
jgi:hypothetical protein